jgi:hypothetical protein
MSDTDEKDINEVPDVDEAKKDVRVPRKPGRPRKKPANQPKPKSGVVSKPTDDQHYIEFLYDEPMIFKKIWQFFKLMAVTNIRMLFGADNILIYCKDHHEKSDIRVKIDCNLVNHYYCKNELDIGIFCENLKKIMSTIDRNYNSILFLSTCDNIQKNIQVILKNSLDIEEHHKIELIGEYENIDKEKEFLDEEFAVKFELSGKYLKKVISDIKTFSDQIAIRLDGPDDNLAFEYINNDKKIKSLHTMKNNSAIKLENTLGEDDAFRASFKIDYVRPISAAILSENVKIYADENKRLKFINQMDNAIEIIILTEIIDIRET